jgi:four helix bundle protein
MSTIRRFEDIPVWKKSRQFCKDLNNLTIEGSFARDFELRNQINRSSGSVMDNIAEGFEREGRAEFIQFLSIAKASAGEVKSQLYRAVDRGHIDEHQFQLMYERLDEIGKMLRGFIEYLKNCEIKGLKYKPLKADPSDPRTENK